MNDDDAPPGAEERPTWRPTMSRIEAERWARASVYRVPLFHATTPAAGLAIRQLGFDVRFRTFGQVWGDGVYATADPEVIALYRALVSSGKPSVLELRVDLRTVLAVRVRRGERRDQVRDRILRLIPGGYSRWILELVILRPLHGDAAPALAFGRVLRGAGYDGLEIVEEVPTADIGGSQLVVYDSRNIVVIADD